MGGITTAVTAGISTGISTVVPTAVGTAFQGCSMEVVEPFFLAVDDVVFNCQSSVGRFRSQFVQLVRELLMIRVG